MTNTIEERTQGAIFQGPTGNLQGTYNLFLLGPGKRINRGKLTEVPTPTIVIKRVAEMALAEKQNEGLIFEKHTGATVNDILPDEKANEVFNKIDGNISGVDSEAKIQEPAAHTPPLNNNQYVELAGNEDDEKNGDDQENDTESTGVENDGKVAGVRHGDKITGVDSNNERTGVKS